MYRSNSVGILRKNSFEFLSVLTLLLIFIAPSIVYFDVLIGGKTLSFNPQSAIRVAGITNTTVSDPAAGSWQDEPWLFYIRQSLLQGRFPLANLQNAMGEPFVESLQTGVFYPPNLLLPFLPAESSCYFDIFQVVHVYLLLIGFLLLARLYVVSLPAAAFLALSATFTGTTYLNINMVHFRAYAWLPIILYGAVQSARGRYRAAFCALAIGIACSMTAGNPQESVMHIYACIVVYAFERLRLWAEGRGSRRFVDELRQAGIFGLVCSAALLLAAPGVWPFLAAQNAGELFSVGDVARSVEVVDFGWLTTWFFPKLVGLFPAVFIPPPYPIPQADGSPQLWIGLLAGAAAMFSKSNRRFRIPLMLLSIICVLGFLKIAHLPMFDFFGSLPFLRGIRFHKYYFYLFTLFFVLSIFCIQKLLELSPPILKRNLLIGLVSYLVIIALVIFKLISRPDYVYDPQNSQAELHAVWITAAVTALAGFWCLWKRSSLVWTLSSVLLVVISAWGRPGGFYDQRPKHLPFAGSGLNKKWVQELSTGRIASSIVANSNLFYPFDLLGTFNPVLNTYYAGFVAKHLRLINPFFTPQPDPNVPLNMDELDALRLLGVTSLHRMTLDAAVTRSLKRRGVFGFTVNGELPRVFTMPELEAQAVDTFCQTNPTASQLLTFLSGKTIESARQWSKNGDGRSISFAFDAPQSGKRLVINYAAAKAWHFEQSVAKPLCQLWASFPAGDTKEGRVEYWPLGLSAAFVATAVGILLILTLLIFVPSEKQIFS